MKTTNVDQRLQRVIAETPYLLKAGLVPGFTVALLEGGKTRDVLCFGATDPDGQTPITEATVFQAASLSKQVRDYSALLKRSD